MKLVGTELSADPCDRGFCMLEDYAVAYVGHGSSVNEDPGLTWLLASASLAC